MAQFGISQPLLRLEDHDLLLGKGTFLDNQSFPGMAYGVAVRSPHAHAEIRSVDTAAAKAMPGVLAVYAPADVADLGDIPTLAFPAMIEGTEHRHHGQPVLARDRVRYAGQCVAFVVAETLVQARDAAEAVMVDYDPLPAVTDPKQATRKGAPQLWDDAPENRSFEFELGDKAATDAGFAEAERVISLDVINNRVILSAMETRGALGRYEDGRYILHATTQMPHRLKEQLADKVFGVPRDNVRVLVGDVGGGFGGKNGLYAENCLVLHAARDLGRPVKWVSDRSEAFLSDTGGRDNVTTGELATSVSAYVTHGVLSGGAVARVEASPMEQLVITDSIQATEAVLAASNITPLTIAPLLGEAIKRIAEERSVSSLFD